MTMDPAGDRMATWIRLGTRLAVLTAILVLYQGMDTGSLIASDDSIYARAAVEGARDGRFIDVTWMGRVLFEKGPLLFGGIQLSGLFGGPVEQQARFPGIVAGVLILLLIYRIGRDLGMSVPAAMVSAAFCLSTNLFYFNARRPMTDIPGLMLALAGFRTFLVAASARKHFLAGVLFGLSALFKLTAPVPFIAAAFAFRLIRDRGRNTTALRGVVTGAGWCLAGMALAAVPWHAAMTAVHGREFITTYFGFHLFHRISQSIAGSGAADTYAGWMIARDPGASLVLLFALPACILMAARKDLNAIAALLLIAFAVLPPAVSSTALPHYIVPVLPGAALAVGLCADRLINLSGGKRVLLPTLIAGMGALMAIIFLTTNLDDMTRPDYSHDSKALCEIMMSDGSVAHIAGTFDLHDTAIPLYCDTEMKFYGLNPGYDAALRDIPMLKGTYVLFRNEMAGGMADTGEVLVCDSYGLEELKDIAQHAGLVATSRNFGTRFAVSFVRP